MKKYLFWTLCAMALMGWYSASTQSAAYAKKKVATAHKAAAPEMPIPVGTVSDNGALVYYWIELDEPKYFNDMDPDYFDNIHNQWEVQQGFINNARAYTNLFLEDAGKAKVRYNREQLKDPDGNNLDFGVMHYRPEVPNCGVYLDIVQPNSQITDYRQGVIVTDKYLQTHRQLPITVISTPWETVPMPADIVRRLEQKYDMVADTTVLRGKIDDRYLYGSVQFKGYWKDAPALPEGQDYKQCLAVDVLADGETLYVNEQTGYYSSPTDFGWNVDDDGFYTGCIPVAAFEGEDGLSLCYYHPAPESVTVGIYTPENGRLTNKFNTQYQSMIDDEIPVWKKDMAAMERLYKENDQSRNGNMKFNAWSHVVVDFENEWIWAVESEKDPIGGIFLRKDGQFTLIAETTNRLGPSVSRQDDLTYLVISGSAGGPSWYTEVYVIKDGKVKDTFTCLEVYNKIDDATLNGKPISIEEAAKFKNSIPETSLMPAYFREI